MGLAQNTGQVGLRLLVYLVKDQARTSGPEKTKPINLALPGATARVTVAAESK
jgi:hypothetical protein